MKKINKFYLFLLFLLFLFFTSKSYTAENKKFLSLKNNKVNLRQGPSFRYPIKLTYNKKYLPVFILDQSDAWRKIGDLENNTGWIHISQLTKKKTAINVKNNTILYKNPTIFSKPIAKIEIGRLLLIKKCKIKWCKVKSKNYKGWVFKDSLWGKIK